MTLTEVAATRNVQVADRNRARDLEKVLSDAEVTKVLNVARDAARAGSVGPRKMRREAKVRTGETGDHGNPDPGNHPEYSNHLNTEQLNTGCI